MVNRNTIIIIRTIFLCLFPSIVSYAQSVGVKADRDHILIGERIQYEIQIDLPGPGYSVNFHLPDTIPNFVVIGTRHFDTTRSNMGLLLHKVVLLTSFDSGSRTIPSFDVDFAFGGKVKTIKTQPLPIEVGFAASDTTGLKDIKPNLGVTVTNNRWIFIVAIILAVLLISLLVYFYFRKRRRQQPPSLFQSKLPAFEEALQTLDGLQWKGNGRAEVLAYYEVLAACFKRYYSRQKNTKMETKTTGDLLLMMKGDNIDTGVVSEIAASLREADAVKFAKFIPSGDQAEQQKQSLKQAIRQLNLFLTTPSA